MKSKYFFKLIILLFFIALQTIVFAQEKKTYTISGYVKDASNGESSIGANVYIKELLKGSNTNQYGFYSITVDKGTYHLIVSYLGYQDFVKEIVLDKDVRLNVELKTTAITTQEVEVTSEKSDKNVTSTSVGAVKMDMAEIKKNTGLYGRSRCS